MDWRHAWLDHYPERMPGPQAFSEQRGVGVGVSMYGDEWYDGRLRSIWAMSRQGSLSLVVQRVEVYECPIWFVFTGPDYVLVMSASPLRLPTPQPSPKGEWWEKLGFALEESEDEFVSDPDAFGIAEARVSLVVVPYWSLVLGPSLPLMLLAGALLVARRRRKGRGFAVEPASDAAQPAIDPPPPPLEPPPALRYTPARSEAVTPPGTRGLRGGGVRGVG